MKFEGVSLSFTLAGDAIAQRQPSEVWQAWSRLQTLALFKVEMVASAYSEVKFARPHSEVLRVMACNAVSDVAGMRSRITEEEWQQRVNLAACYRAVALFGWDDLIFTHISARVPGDKEHFLINPYGMLFDEITASNLLKVDLGGNKVMESQFGINPAGYIIHSAIHAARPDAGCVLHLHCPNGVAVASQKCGLRPISQQAMVVQTSLAYHDYEGIVLSEDEKPRLVSNLADKHFLILRNHGLLTVGETIADAFVFMYLFESACRIQLLAQSGNEELISIDDRIISGAMAQAKKVMGDSGAALVWPAILRKLDRIDLSFRD